MDWEMEEIFEDASCIASQLEAKKYWPEQYQDMI